MFSKREEVIIGLIKQGLTNKEMAALLNIKEKTVKWYLTGIFKKAMVRNRVQLAVKDFAA